jgi:hypothetical protein
LNRKNLSLRLLLNLEMLKKIGSNCFRSMK